LSSPQARPMGSTQDSLGSVPGIYSHIQASAPLLNLAIVVEDPFTLVGKNVGTLHFLL
jgi:hypothetical protein